MQEKIKQVWHKNGKETQYTTYELPTKGYHSIICIDDYNCMYDDPCWNACKYQKGDKSMKWLLKTKSQISEDHTLSFDERSIENDHLQESQETIEYSISKNEAFLKQQEQRKNKKIKGQINRDDEIIESAIDAAKIETRTENVDKQRQEIINIQKSRQQTNEKNISR